MAADRWVGVNHSSDHSMDDLEVMEVVICLGQAKLLGRYGMQVVSTSLVCHEDHTVLLAAQETCGWTDCGPFLLLLQYHLQPPKLTSPRHVW